MISEMLREVPPFFYLVTCFTFVIGACMGSFLNVCVWRIPRGESIVSPPSHCPKCNYKIPTYLNVPILAWLVLRGKCANCRVKIPARYFYMEVASGLMFLFIWLVLFYSKKPYELFFPYATLASVLLTCGMIDYDLKIIPNKLTFFGVIAAVLFAVGMPLAGALPLHSTSYHFTQGEIFVPLLQHLFNFQIEKTWIYQISQCGLGVLFGYFSIAAMIEFGKLVYGKRHVNLDKEEPLNFGTEEGELKIAGEIYDLDDLIMRPSDRLVVESNSGSLKLKSGKEIDLSGKSLSFSDEFVELDSEKHKLDDVESISAQTLHWTIPQEVMGYGDAKLLAVCGGFLGPELIFYIISLASIIGMAVMIPLSYMAQRKNAEVHFAFGPFISIAAYIILLLML